ncbi:MAG: hypothetical protein OEO77_07545 [Acidimicrobiia bacterium]|nr:hypothetical protein [Acidimicrobiia bacterium]
MHTSRLFAVGGVIVGVIGLFMTALRTDGQGTLVALNAANPAFPDGIPTIWGGLATWAQIVLVILILAVLVLALRPDRSQKFSQTDGAITAVIGVALLAYAVVKWMEAGDEAETLAGAFGQAFAGGFIPEAYSVGTGIGFLVLIVGTVLVAAGGIIGMQSDSA